MKHLLKSGTAAVVVLFGLLVLSPTTKAQDPAPSPDPPVTQPSPEPTTAPTPETDFWKRDEMTGNWDETRDRWRAKGVELEFRLTNFVQGVTSGGVNESTVYNGKFTTEFEFDLGKLFGWHFWSAEVRTETRFSNPLLGGTGAINPVNTSALIPATSGNVIAITALNFTRLIPIDLKKGELVAIKFGRFNTVAALDEDFFAGDGDERFFNVANVGPLTVARVVPLVSNGVAVAWIKKGKPFLTVLVIDPNDHSTDSGLRNLFSAGVSFVPSVNLYSKWFERSGSHTFSAGFTTKAYTPFDQIRQIILPGPPAVPLESKRGSWVLNYTGRQYLVERGPRDGWGLFVQASKSQPSTSPISTFFNIGIGGNGLFKQRRNDEFGIAYAYTDLSDTLKAAIDPLNRLRSEHLFEVFYNLHITPWLRLTGDLQVIRPARSIANTAVVPGARLEFIF